jgi:hypothetical protein
MNVDKVLAEHLECRTLAHAWRYTTVERDGRNYVQGRSCTRCDCQKYVTISPKGELVSSRYVYPAGYTVPGGVTAEDRNGLRLRSVGANPADARTPRKRSPRLRAVS